MATQVKEKSPGKHASFVEAQLARAESRIRLIDLSAGLLAFLAGTLAYAVGMIVLDRLFLLSGGTRQVALLVYLAATVAYFALVVVRPLWWRVNPYYAARQLEQTLPGSRNHVVNWIDLRDQKLPGVIKTTLGQRAARDLSRTDVDRAISGRRALLAAAAAGLFVVLFIISFLLLGPAPFASFLSRTFAPFGSTGVATRTQVEIVRPEGGNAVVTIGNPVTIVARVGGRIPNPRDKDAPCLVYRHDPSEPYRQRYLQRTDSGDEWATTIAPVDVRNGFFYKVTAGDSERGEYRVEVRAAPGIRDFEATYHYRPYLRRADHTEPTKRRLEAVRGTRVTLLAHTNRAVKEGRLDFEGDDGIAERVRAESVPNDPGALHFNWVLDRNGKYRIRFTSTDGEAYAEQSGYDVVVLPDQPPRARITGPAKDVTLPADGHLEIRGEASDDFGVARLTLCLEMAGGKVKLAQRPYLADRLGKPGYGTPRRLGYHHVLELPSLLDEQGKPVRLAPGTRIDYWLEAADACDYPGPGPNVTQSTPRYKITIAEGKADEKQKKDAEAAAKRQKDQEKKAAEQAKQEESEREKKRKQDEEQEKADKQQRDEEKQAQGGNGGNEGDKQDDKQGDGQGPGGTKPGDKKVEDQAKQLKESLDKHGKGDKGGGAGEGSDGAGNEDGQGQDGKGKDGGKPSDKPGNDGKEGDGKSPSSSKGPGKPGTKPGQSKSPPSGAGAGQETGERKPDKLPDPGEKMRENNGKPRKTEGLSLGEGKPGEKDQGKPGEGKPGGTQGSQGKEGAGKGKPGDKPGSAQPPPADRGDPNAAPGQGKQGSQPPNHSGAKPSDVEKAAGDLKSSDPKRRHKAANDLRGMQKQASDPATRDAARQALEQAEKDGLLGKAGGAGEPGDRKEKGAGDGSPGASKDRGPNREPKKDNGPSGEPKDGQKDRSGSNPGGGAGERRNTGNGGGAEPPKRGDRPGRHRASMLQLEEFKKKVDRDILKDAKMSREQFEQFLRDYADLVRRQQAEKEEPGKGPARRGDTLPSMVGGTKGRPGGKATDLKSEGRAKPPPEYREAYSDFLKLTGQPPR
jgi:hypothetical protein